MPGSTNSQLRKGARVQGRGARSHGPSLRFAQKTASCASRHEPLTRESSPLASPCCSSSVRRSSRALLALGRRPTPRQPQGSLRSSRSNPVVWASRAMRAPVPPCASRPLFAADRTSSRSQRPREPSENGPGSREGQPTPLHCRVEAGWLCLRRERADRIRAKRAILRAKRHGTYSVHKYTGTCAPKADPLVDTCQHARTRRSHRAHRVDSSRVPYVKVDHDEGPGPRGEWEGGAEEVLNEHGKRRVTAMGIPLGTKMRRWTRAGAAPRPDLAVGRWWRFINSGRAAARRAQRQAFALYSVAQARSAAQLGRRPSGCEANAHHALRA